MNHRVDYMLKLYYVHYMLVIIKNIELFIPANGFRLKQTFFSHRMPFLLSTISACLVMVMKKQQQGYAVRPVFSGLKYEITICNHCTYLISLVCTPRSKRQLFSIL